MTTQTFFYRSDVHTVNTINSRALLNQNGSQQEFFRIAGVNTDNSSNISSSVFIVNSGGVSTIIGSGVAGINLDAQGDFFNTNASWTPALRSLLTTDAIRVTEVLTILPSGFVGSRDFITAQLNQTRLSANTWNFNRDVGLNVPGKGTDSFFTYGSSFSTSDSHISGVLLDRPAPTPTNISGSVLSSSRILWACDNISESGEFRVYNMTDIQIGRIVRNGTNWEARNMSNQVLGTYFTPQFPQNGLVSNTSYSIRISYFVSDTSTESTRVTSPVVTTMVIPTVVNPSGFTLSSSRVNFTWDGSSLNTIYFGYRLYDTNNVYLGRVNRVGVNWEVRNASNTLIATHSSPQYLVSGLSAGTAVSLKVRVYDLDTNEEGTTVLITAITNTLPTLASILGNINSLNNITWTLKRA